ncbi:MAG: choloylglycine hydrolase family protein [Simkaniaceae bacterium]|nr:choloylglycine hydrolase family protein [Simkaniaceae bacterium]
MKKNIFKTLIATLCLSSELMACTGLRLTATDGSVITGRTVEFGTQLDMSAAIIPRNLTFTGDTPLGKGLIYKSKYAAVGIYCFDAPILMDGMNEMGLVAAAFYFPGYASYTEVTKSNQSLALSPIDFTQWLLTQFASIDEVKRALPSIIIAPTVLNHWGNEAPPFHYIVYDKHGNSIVIEPIEGQLIVYDNPIGTITNSPSFDWQITNLRNFINLTPFNVKPVEMRGVELFPFGQGSGMVGLPGDFTPPSRFVRAAIFSSTAIPSTNASDTVNQTFHLLNQFDIPVGIARQKSGDMIHTDYTMLTSVKDPQSMRYYFKSYTDQLIRYVELKPQDMNARQIKKMGTVGQEIAIDVSAMLH